VPRRPPHFKIFTSIQNHRHLEGVYEDDALLAMYVRAGIMAVERFADRTSDSFLLSSTDLCRLAGLDHGVANARKKLGRLEAASRLGLSRDGARWRLTFPNFAKKHGFKGGNGSLTGEFTASASASVSEGLEEEEKRPPATAKPGSSEPDREPHGGKDDHVTDAMSLRLPPEGTPTPGAVDSPRRRAAPRGRYQPSPEAEAALDLLTWAIDQSMPGASVPEPGTGCYQRWCQELDRLHSLGEKGGSQGFAWEEIMGVIRWLPGHGRGDFRWGLVVRSAAKLRQHFARLLAECRNVVATPTRSGGWRQAAQEVHQRVMETGDG
jgi:hypothetical protein